MRSRSHAPDQLFMFGPRTTSHHERIGNLEHAAGKLWAFTTTQHPPRGCYGQVSMATDHSTMMGHYPAPAQSHASAANPNDWFGGTMRTGGGGGSQMWDRSRADCAIAMLSGGPRMRIDATPSLPSPPLPSPPRTNRCLQCCSTLPARAGRRSSSGRTPGMPIRNSSISSRRNTYHYHHRSDAPLLSLYSY